MENLVLCFQEGLNVDMLECGDSVLSLLLRAIDRVSSHDLSKALKHTEALIALATEKFYAYPYKDVPRCWRRLYVDASLVQTVAQLCLGDYAASVRTLDMASIMAGGEGRQSLINHIFDELEGVLAREPFDVPEAFPIIPSTVLLKHPIPRVNAPSLESFQKHMNNHHTPLILMDIMSQWKAMERWTSPTYFLRRTLNGTRLVPIELGESYVADTWTQKLVQFSTFMQDHLLKQSLPRGYLAQHDLLTQIPQLRNDIIIPDYCYSIPPRHSPDDPKVPYIETDDVLTNIWMGPGGTRSPLHNDPYENIFAQVVGHKYFRLFPPSMTTKIYPRGTEGGIQMGNTSQVKHSSMTLRIGGRGKP